MSHPFAEAVALIREKPVLLVPGIVFAVISGLIIVIGGLGDFFIAGKLLFISFVVAPFFIAGFLHLTRVPVADLREFVAGGTKYYFNVLIPGLIIGFALALTILLLLIPISLVGLNPLGGVLAGAVLGVIIPFVFFTFFFDTGAVLEDRPVFESIRRSIELVMRNTWQTIVFFFTTFVFVCAVGLFLMIAWTSALYDRLEPLSGMNTTEMQSFTPEKFGSVLGTDGIWISAILATIGIAILFSIIWAYKTTFFLAISEGKS